MGGNSLLELVVFGKIAGENAAKFENKNAKIEDAKAKEEKTLGEIFAQKNEIDFYGQRDILGELFYKNVGIVRSEVELSEVYKTVQDIKAKLPLMGVGDKSKIYNTNLVEFLEFVNALEICELVVAGALERKESCGAHFRADEECA